MGGRSDYAPPSFEEVKRFAEEEGLVEKISVSRFYDYYSKSDFLFRGMPMDWKAKLREWASTERTGKRKMVNAADYSSDADKGVTAEYLAYIRKTAASWGKSKKESKPVEGYRCTIERMGVQK